MESQVVAQVGGVVARVVRKAGDWVQAGDTVIQLDDSQLQLSVKTAQAALEAARINLSTGQDTTQQASPTLDLQVQSAQSALAVAQRNFDSRKALFDLGGATGADLDKAKSDLETAKANLEEARTAQDQNSKADVQNIAQLKLSVQQADFALQQAQLNLQHASIRAPYAGRLVSVKMMPGEFAGQDLPAFIIGSREREIDFAVPPADAATLPQGAAVTFTLNGKSYQLKVTQSSEVPLNGVVPLVAALPPSLPLTFGAVGTVGYSVTLARGAIVQTGALQTNEDQNFVYVVEGGKALARPITILAESGDSAAVTGVDAGQPCRGEPAAGAAGRVSGEAAPALHGRKQVKTTRDIQAKLFDRINPAVRFSVTRYVFAIGVFVAIFAFGLISVMNLGVDQFPSLNFPYVVVTTAYPGASPSVVDQQITQVLENAVSTLGGITDINSTSSTGASQIIISFDQSTDQNSDANKVASMVSAVTRVLPLGVYSPIVQTFDPSAIPVVQFGVSGSGASLGDVSTYVTNELTPAAGARAGRRQRPGGRRADPPVPGPPEPRSTPVVRPRPGAGCRGHLGRRGQHADRHHQQPQERADVRDGERPRRHAADREHVRGRRRGAST